MRGQPLRVALGYWMVTASMARSQELPPAVPGSPQRWAMKGDLLRATLGT